MNCANHPQNPVAAYCRTCGKPLCTSCTRQVAGVIYCENCLAERMTGAGPASPYTTPAAPVAASSGPNPGLAGILGAIPFGVGAIYCGQYIKGLVYLGIFVFLVVAQSSNVPDYIHVILGFAIAFFVFYQIIDAVRTAKAMQAGQPVPDPLGLVATFSPGGKPADAREISRRVPFGAIVLIGLGLLFLLHNLGMWFLRPGVVWSGVLIALGVWLFVRRFEPGADPRYRARGIVGPAVLVTIGLQALLDNLDVVPFERTLPALLIVIGVAIVIQRNSAPPQIPMPPPGSGDGSSLGPPASDVSSSSEVHNG